MPGVRRALHGLDLPALPGSHEAPRLVLPSDEQLGKRNYVFVRGSLRVRAHRILDDRFDGRFPSDHLPVLAVVVVTEQPPPD